MEFNKRNIKIVIGLIIFAICFWTAIQNLNDFRDGLTWTIGLFAPFIIGGAMAFVLNIPMTLWEKALFNAKRIENKKVLGKIKRPISLLLAFLTISLIIFVVSFMIIPEFLDTLGSMQSLLPTFFENLQNGINDLQNQWPELGKMLKHVNIDWNNIQKDILNYVQDSALGFLSSTIDVASNIAGGVMNFVIAFVFALYILIDKEGIGKQMRRVFYAILPEKASDRLMEILALSQKSFTNFVTGQLTEMVILGSIFFVCMTIFGFPYAPMISVLIGFLSFIPLFGAFLGCGLGAMFILINDPMQALWFVIMFFIIQQLEGNLIYPRVVGSSVGLPATWVLIGVSVGGSMFGLTGMIVTIPICSIFYTLFWEFIGKKLKQRKIGEDKLYAKP